MSAKTIMKVGVRVAEWATPYVQKWQKKRNLNRVEAQRYMDLREWSEAEKHFRLALEEKHHNLPDRIGFLLGLAEAQRCQGELENAERTVTLAGEVAGNDKALCSQALEALAKLQLEGKRYEEAEKSAREAIRLETECAKPDYARLASRSRKLGLALEHCGRSAAASDALTTGLAHAEKAFGADHAETASFLHDLGMLHRRHGDHASAQGHFRKALKVHRTLAAVPGANGIDAKAATDALHNLAVSLEESGNADEAAAEYEKMLHLRERQVGADPIETAEARVRLAALHLRTGRTSSARELLARAIPALDRQGGPLLERARELLIAAEEQAARPAGRR